MTTVSGFSQSDSEIHLADWLNSSVKSSLPAAWCDDSWFGTLFSHVTTACTTSFTYSSDEGALPC